jgi:Zn-dependent metalloprotease
MQQICRNNYLLVFFLLTTFSLGAFAERDPHQITVFSDKNRPDLVISQDKLRQGGAWKNFVQRNGAWHVTFDGFTYLPMRAAGKGIATTGNDAQSRAWSFLQTELKGFAMPLDDLQFKQTNISKKYQIVNYEQQYKGLPVLNTNMRVRLTMQHQVVGFTANLHPRIDIATIASLPPSAVANYATVGMQGNLETETPTLAVLPIPHTSGYTYKLVYCTQVKGVLANGKKADYYTLVDAHDGTVYYRQNKVVYCSFETHEAEQVAADIVVQADISENPELSIVTHYLPDMRIRIGTTDYYTDQNGVLNYTGTEVVNGTAYFEGPHARVRVDNATTTPSYPVTIDPATTTMTIAIPTSQLSTPSGFLHVNRQYRHLKQWITEDIGLEGAMDTYVDISSDNCNAYYDGDVNFYAEGSGCAATAQVNDVVYHEYGHGINDYFYTYLGENFNNGSLGEGYADVWGLHLTGNPILGPGFSGGGTWVRRYDENIKVYPQDLTGEVHDNGEIIAGAWWDLGQAIGLDPMFALFIETHYATPMRPDGEEGLLYSDILYEALLADDDNGNIFDGTPHSVEIIQAFGLHGITLLVGATLAHQELPTYAANATIPIGASVNIDFDFTPFLDGVVVGYRTADAAPYIEVAATELSAGNYLANIPAQEAGTIVDYYIAVVDNVGGKIYAPFGILDSNPNVPYQLLVGYETLNEQAFSTVASGADWSLDDIDDDATSGEWEIGQPNPTYVNFTTMVQTNTDNSPSNDNRCAFTGNGSDPDSPGANDVDAGKNTLISQNYNLIQVPNPAFSFYRWYSNDQGANPGNDYWKVDISNDGGASWVPVENTNVADHSWRLVAFKVEDYVSLSAEVMLRFVASDVLIPGMEFEGGSLVEAAIDDVVLYRQSTVVGTQSPTETPLVRTYPNPTTEWLYIAPNKNLSTPAQIALYDISGKLAWQSNGVNLSNVRYGIPVAQLAAGTYVLEVKNAEGLYRQKVAVK